MKSFREQMISLHTGSQIPGRGRRPHRHPEDFPVQKWNPTRADVLGYLRETYRVHLALERGLQANGVGAFDGTSFAGLRMRTLEFIADDIRRIGSSALDPVDESDMCPNRPGRTYARHLKTLSEEDEVLFACHYYSVFSAHASGGRIVGRHVENTLKLAIPLMTFTRPEEEDLSDLKAAFEEYSRGWSPEDQARAADEAHKIFAHAGSILRLLAPESDM